MEGVKLTFTDTALKEIASKAGQEEDWCAGFTLYTRGSYA